MLKNSILVVRNCYMLSVDVLCCCVGFLNCFCRWVWVILFMSGICKVFWWLLVLLWSCVWVVVMVWFILVLWCGMDWVWFCVCRIVISLGMLVVVGMRWLGLRCLLMIVCWVFDILVSICGSVVVCLGSLVGIVGRMWGWSWRILGWWWSGLFICCIVVWWFLVISSGCCLGKLLLSCWLWCSGNVRLWSRCWWGLCLVLWWWGINWWVCWVWIGWWNWVCRVLVYGNWFGFCRVCWFSWIFWLLRVLWLWSWGLRILCWCILIVWWWICGGFILWSWLLWWLVLIRLWNGSWRFFVVCLCWLVCWLCLLLVVLWCIWLDVSRIRRSVGIVVDCCLVLDWRCWCWLVVLVWLVLVLLLVLVWLVLLLCWWCILFIWIVVGGISVCLVCVVNVWWLGCWCWWGWRRILLWICLLLLGLCGCWRILLRMVCRRFSWCLCCLVVVWWWWICWWLCIGISWIGWVVGMLCCVCWLLLVLGNFLVWWGLMVLGRIILLWCCGRWMFCCRFLWLLGC